MGVTTHHHTMPLLIISHVLFLTLLPSCSPAPHNKPDFRTVCRNGCPAILGGVSGRSFVVPTSKHMPQPKTEPEPESGSEPLSIPEIVSTNEDLSTLLAAVSAAGLVEALSAKGPFTVFAPTDQAFEKISQEALAALLEDKDALTAVLARHVIAGAAIKAGDIELGITKVETLGGEEVEVIRAGDSVAIRSAAGTANVVSADVMATNGVIHVVDSVF